MLDSKYWKIAKEIMDLRFKRLEVFSKRPISFASAVKSDPSRLWTALLEVKSDLHFSINKLQNVDEVCF